MNPVKVTKSNGSLTKIMRNSGNLYATVAQNSINQGQFFWAVIHKEFKNSQPKVDKSRYAIDHVKTGQNLTSFPSNYRNMLFSAHDAVASCKEQENTKSVLFYIQIIGLERDGLLLKKETLWKK
jgi:hypothetical protein